MACNAIYIYQCVNDFQHQYGQPTLSMYPSLHPLSYDAFFPLRKKCLDSNMENILGEKGVGSSMIQQKQKTQILVPYHALIRKNVNFWRKARVYFHITTFGSQKHSTLAELSAASNNTKCNTTKKIKQLEEKLAEKNEKNKQLNMELIEHKKISKGWGTYIRKVGSN